MGPKLFKTRDVRGRLADTAMLSPLLLYVLSFTFLPVVSTFIISLTNKADKIFPTLFHYRTIFSQADFPYAVFNTIVLTAAGVSMEVCVGLGLAVALTHIKRGKGTLRTLFLIPIGVPTLVSGVVMTYIFASSGYANEILLQLGLISAPLDFKSGGFLTYAMVVLADMWKVTPLVILLLLAGLESIPQELYEAAKVDGANFWQSFWHVTLPMLKPTITMVVIIRAIDAFRIFELPLILVGRTFPVMGTYAYFEYADYNNAGASAAASTLLFFMILIFVIVYLFVAERRITAKMSAAKGESA